MLLRDLSRRQVILWSILANLMSKGIAFILLFVAIPLTLPYLGAERFGVFMTVLSYAAILTFFDLGIGNALIGDIARHNAAKDEKALRLSLSSGLLMLVFLGVLMGSAGLAVALYVPPDLLFKNLSIEHHDEVRASLVVFVLAYAASIPLQGMQRVMQGLQKSYVAHAASAALATTALILLLIASSRHAGIPVLIAIAYAVPLLAPLAYAAFLFREYVPWGWLGWPALWAGARRLFGLGGLFFLLQLGAVVGWGMDGALTSALLGAASAGTLAIVQRLFQLITYPLAIVNAPLWPAYADALARADKAFIRKTFRRSLIYTFSFAVLAAIGLCVLREPIQALWIGKGVILPTELVFLVAAWTVVEATGNAFAMYLNGMLIIKPQLYVNLFFIVLSLTLKYFAITNFGLVGIPAAALIAYLIAVILPYLTVFRAKVLLQSASHHG